MEAFKLLSRGGAKFDKNRFQKDVSMFNPKTTEPKQKQKPTADQGSIPAELDFFRYSQNVGDKRKAGKGDENNMKRWKANSDAEDEKEGEDKERKDDAVPREQAAGPSSTQSAKQPRQRVTAKGTNVPRPAETFETVRDRYNVPSLLLSNLTQNGYLEPTGIQSHGLPILLEFRDLAAISPTGTGKTLSYLLPIFANLGSPSGSPKTPSSTPGLSGVRALIIAPTRELAHQIHNECLKLAQGRKWRIVLFSKATANTLSDKAVRDKTDIVISTPLRLVASLQAGSLELHNVRHLVLDEADRLLDSEFLSQVEEIIAACTHTSVQKAVFSATLPANAEKIAMDMMRDPIRVVVGLKDTPLPLISQSLTYTADDPSKLPAILSHFAQPYNPPVLVFTSTQPRASALAEELVLNGIPNVDCLHAGMTVKEREDAVSRMRRGESWVMVTTEVMARGMDFKGVSEVINYDFPTSVQSYVHRIGRTGRAGREGKAVTFFTDQDAAYLKPIANVLLQSGSTVPYWISKLPKPSKMKRKLMGKVKRAEVINFARKIGRNDAIKKRDMIAGSKRRKEKETRPQSVGEMDVDAGQKEYR